MTHNAITPEGWVYQPLKQLCDFKSGIGFPEIHQGQKKERYKFLKVSDLNHPKNQKYIFEATNTVSEDTLLKLKATAFPKGSIVFPKVGAALLSNRRRILIEAAAMDNNMMAAIPKEGAYGQFLYHVLCSIDFSEYVQLGAVPSINKGTLDEITISVPPYSEQIHIAEILDGVEVAIEATKSVIEQTKKVKQGLLQTLLTRGIGHTRFKTSPLGEIPQEWKIVEFGDVVKKIEGGVSVNSEDRIKISHELAVLKTSCVQGGKFYPNEHKTILKEEYNRVKTQPVAGSIIFSRMNTPALVGESGYVEHSYHDLYLPDRLWLLTADTKQVLSKWLSYVMVSQRFKATLSQMATGTSGSMKNISKPKLQSIEIALPPLPEQKAINAILADVDNQLDCEIAKLASLQHLKKGLMQDLLTGKVRVKAAAPALHLVQANEKPAQKAVQPAFKRAVLAAEITHQLYQNPKFGSVKQEKIIDLCERHLDLDAELDRNAYRQAAGPYDNKAKRSIEANFKSHKWFDVQRITGKGVKYMPLEKCGQHKTYFGRYFGHISTDIQSIIDLLKDLDTERCEIVATLYAAWNDFLLKGQTPDDEAIVNDVLNNWHDKKRQIPKDRWLKALPWMRQKNLVPHGSGRPTKGINPSH